MDFNMESAAVKLREMACSEGNMSERLKPSFHDNNPYKVCYRLLANMIAPISRNDIGLERLPTEAEAIEIAKAVDPYFVRLFDDPGELEGFKSTYEFIRDAWED